MSVRVPRAYVLRPASFIHTARRRPAAKAAGLKKVLWRTSLESLTCESKPNQLEFTISKQDKLLDLTDNNYKRGTGKTMKAADGG